MPFFSLVKKCDCIDGKASAMAKIALLLYIAFMNIAPQWYSLYASMSSIHFNRMKIWLEIDQFSSLHRFWTKRLQMTRLTRKRQAATFSFHQNISHQNWTENFRMTPKSRFIYSQISIVVNSERFIGSSSNIIVPHKSEMKWIYWPSFSQHILIWLVWKLK